MGPKWQRFARHWWNPSTAHLLTCSEPHSSCGIAALTGLPPHLWPWLFQKCPTSSVKGPWLDPHGATRSHQVLLSPPSSLRDFTFLYVARNTNTLFLLVVVVPVEKTLVLSRKKQFSHFQILSNLCLTAHTRQEIMYNEDAEPQTTPQNIRTGPMSLTMLTTSSQT